MLYNLNHIRGHKLAASDGPIGHVKDFYFDDKSWAVRYLVVDTGTWLTGRKVLLSPHAFGRLDNDGKSLAINLTRNQIENSPPIDADRPVSRQYEENYYRYYGWPVYWEGAGIWGAGDLPVFIPSSRPYDLLSYEYPRWDDIHLRSTAAVTGYRIESTDGTIGSVSGFMVNGKRWVICELAVETGHWYSGKEILISTGKIRRISFDESKVFVNLTKENIQQTSEDQVVQAGAGTHGAGNCND